MLPDPSHLSLLNWGSRYHGTETDKPSWVCVLSKFLPIEPANPIKCLLAYATKFGGVARWQEIMEAGATREAGKVG